MSEEPDVVGINWRKDPKYGIRYECRGIGPTYEKLYTWLDRNSSYRCVGIDWPWDFFVFDDPKDHDKLIAAFGDHVREYSAEEYEWMKEDLENE